MAMLTELAAKILLNGIHEGMADDANPFIREGSTTWLRYDALSIEPATDDFGGVNTCFWWRGNKVYIMRVEGVGMVDGRTLHLNGIEGKMRVALEGV